MWTLIHADTLTETYLFAVMQGFLGTGVNTLAPIMWASYYGRRSLGGIFGMSRAAQVCGFAVGPLVSAVVFDNTGSYRGAFIALALVAIAASAAAMRLRGGRYQRRVPDAPEWGFVQVVFGQTLTDPGDNRLNPHLPRRRHHTSLTCADTLPPIP